MPAPPPSPLYRFGTFEADPATGELRRQGLRIKLNAQPFQVLLLLLDRPGQVLTREEIARHLWPDGTFVDFDHGVNSAVNRIREALGDPAANPRFIETLARRGYRFIAPVERFGLPTSSAPPTAALTEPTSTPVFAGEPQPVEERPAAVPGTPPGLSRLLATPEDLPKASYPVVQTLFLLLQIMYLAFYIGALANLPEIEDLFAVLPHPTLVLTTLTVTAGILIPLRAFVLCATLFHAPGLRAKYLRIWPLLVAVDLLWSLAPFLLLHHINFGLALSCTAFLVYSPFAQRSLILMGVGAPPPYPA